jgi:simple sugar transport system permease protein
VGISTLLPKILIGITLTPPLIPTLKNLAIPLLSDIPILGQLFFNHNILVYVSVLISIALWYFLFRTQKGLELRSVGEHPMTADSLGINTTKMRYWSTIIGGALIALAGAYLPMVYAGTFTEGMVMGRGWLAIALTFFGGWSPLPILFGSLFFSAVEVLAFRVQVIGSILPYQFLQMLPYVATILVMIFTFKRARVPSFLGKNYDREKRSI